MQTLSGEPHIDFRIQCDIMTQITWPITLYYVRRFQIFNKIDSVLKILEISLAAKKVDHIFEEPLNSHLLQVESTLPQIPRIPLLFSYQQLQHCEGFSELKIISFLFLIAEIHSNMNLKSLQKLTLFFIAHTLCFSDRSVK